EIVGAMSTHLRDPYLPFDDAARIITWLHWVQVWAAEADNLDLLQETADAVFAGDAQRDQWTPQKLIKSWMTTLRGDAAAVVARVLRRHPGATRHFSELGDNRRVDERVRRAIRSRSTLGRTGDPTTG